MKLTLVLFAALVLGGCSGPEDEALLEREYCEMTAIYKHSGGKAGWPEFRDGVTCPTEGVAVWP